MVGLIHLILFDLVKEKAGDDTLLAILNKAHISPDKKFRLNEVYSDEEWRNLLNATQEILECTTEQLFQMYAKKFLQVAKEKFPTFFTLSQNSYEFLCRQPVVHNGFAKGVTALEERDKINDKFSIEKSDKKLITHYKSDNKLCGLYKSLAREVIDDYEDKAEIVEKKCMHHGSKECEIHIVWDN